MILFWTDRQGEDWLRVCAMTVEPLKWSAGIVLDEDHRMSALVACRYLDLRGFGDNTESHHHTCQAVSFLIRFVNPRHRKPSTTEPEVQKTVSAYPL